MNYYIYSLIGFSTLYIFKYELKKILNNLHNIIYYKFYSNIIINNTNIELVNCIEKYIIENNSNINNWIITYNDKKLKYKLGCGKYVINNIYFNIYDEFIILTTKNNNINNLKITLENIINKYYEEIIEVDAIDVSYVIPIFDVNQYYQNEKKND
mgnify:CR=1 FL=1